MGSRGGTCLTVVATAALAATLAASACGSSAHANRRSAVTVSVSGRVGPLRVDESRRAAVVAFAGRPDAEQVGRSDDSERYDALGYDCGSRAGPQGIPLVKRRPRCRTVFFVETRSGRLGIFYSADARYVARLACEDWGLCRTVQLNIPRLLHTLDELDVDRELVRSRVAEIQGAIDAGPKPLKWRLRAQVGDRLQWYELPEEVRSPYQPE